MKTLTTLLAAGALALHVTLPQAAEEGGPPQMAPQAKPVPHDPKAFGPDPSYADKPYDIQEQLRIYGGKSQVPNPRPMLELGRPIYQGGAYAPAGTAFGAKNPTDQAFAIYGDWRNGVARIDDGTRKNTIAATRLNLDVDWKLTGTERLHAFFRPLDNDGRFSRCEKIDGGKTQCRGEFDLKAETLFFEGDLGAILAGATGRYQSFDLPFAVGKIPLLFQNGVWLEDAFVGAAATIPARNSRLLDIANMDTTFFAGFSDVTSAGVRDVFGQIPKRDVSIYGVTSFIEANQGYWEVGYAYTDPRGELQKDQGFHNIGLAFTRRYGGWLSNSVRLIQNFGQHRDPGQRQNADGTLILIENSLVTSRPLTLVPYLNLFYGKDRPQSVARAADAGGILKNTGINFETDGLTGFPKLDDTANNTAGGALGLQYLFDLQQQIVVEWASVNPRSGSDSLVPGRQNALGVRYQRNLTRAWLIRADAMVADRKGLADIAGVRFEIRRKF